jgi:hypothetical protein
MILIEFEGFGCAQQVICITLLNTSHKEHQQNKHLQPFVSVKYLMTMIMRFTEACETNKNEQP